MNLLGLCCASSRVVDTLSWEWAGAAHRINAVADVKSKRIMSVTLDVCV